MTLRYTKPRWGARFSVHFSDLLRKRGGIADPGLTFHSLRHTFADACRDAGVPVEVYQRLMGHVGENRVSHGYGRGHSVAALRRWLVKVEPLTEHG